MLKFVGAQQFENEISISKIWEGHFRNLNTFKSGRSSKAVSVYRAVAPTVANSLRRPSLTPSDHRRSQRVGGSHHSSMEKICVAVRVRPPVTHESSGGTFWKVDDNRVSLHKAHGTPISGISYAFGMSKSPIGLGDSYSLMCLYV